MNSLVLSRFLKVMKNIIKEFRVVMKFITLDFSVHFIFSSTSVWLIEILLRSLSKIFFYFSLKIDVNYFICQSLNNVAKKVKQNENH